MTGYHPLRKIYKRQIFSHSTALTITTQHLGLKYNTLRLHIFEVNVKTQSHSQTLNKQLALQPRFLLLNVAKRLQIRQYLHD